MDQITSNDLPDLSALQVASAPADNIDNTPDFDDLPPPPPPAPVDPETLRKEFEERLIMKLYQSKFPGDLQILAAEFQSVDMLGLSALRDLRKKCDLILGASTSVDMKKRLFNSFVYGIEKVTTSSGYNTTGLTAQLLSDQDFQRDLMRLSLKYLNADETAPELTVGMKLFGSIVQIQANNEINAKLAPADSTAGARLSLNEVNEKFKDL